MFQALLSKSGTSSVGIFAQREIRVNELFSSVACVTIRCDRPTAVNFDHRQRLFRRINLHRASSSFVSRVVRNSAEGFCQLAVGHRIIVKSLVASKKIGGSKVENNFVELLELAVYAPLISISINRFAIRHGGEPFSSESRSPSFEREFQASHRRESLKRQSS